MSVIKEEVSVKHEQIVATAIKRFSHFGINKTTLAEIADDLSISKQALSYYFHDKSSLVDAVAGKILNEFLDEVAVQYQLADSVEEGLINLVEVKRNFFKKYELLAIQAEKQTIINTNPSFAKLYNDAKEENVQLLANLFKKGMERGEMQQMDSLRTASLVNDTLAAFEQCIHNSVIPDAKYFNELFDRQKEVVAMIFNGLKNGAWKN